jgi:hypothetical protein
MPSFSFELPCSITLTPSDRSESIRKVLNPALAVSPATWKGSGGDHFLIVAGGSDSAGNSAPRWNNNIPGSHLRVGGIMEPSQSDGVPKENRDSGWQDYPFCERLCDMVFA